MNLLYEFATNAGPFYIGRRDDSSFHPLFDEESLGGHAEAWQAAEDLVGGHTFSAGAGIDTASLGIPEDPSKWHLLQATDPALE